MIKRKKKYLEKKKRIGLLGWVEATVVSKDQSLEVQPNLAWPNFARWCTTIAQARGYKPLPASHDGRKPSPMKWGAEALPSLTL